MRLLLRVSVGSYILISPWLPPSVEGFHLIKTFQQFEVWNQCALVSDLFITYIIMSIIFARVYSEAIKWINACTASFAFHTLSEIPLSHKLHFLHNKLYFKSFQKIIFLKIVLTQPEWKVLMQLKIIFLKVKSYRS